MIIARYLLALIVSLLCLSLALELGLERFMPAKYRGYLIETGNGMVRWAIGPFEPAQAAIGYNPPIPLKKPAGTLRVIALGTSSTEGWLTARTVYQKYGQRWSDSSVSSYSRALEFSLNSAALPSSQRVEVINLGVAAYNITDVIRMLKDSMRLEPDVLLIQIGGNETWTAERHTWASYVSEDIPYFYTELAHEILSETRAGWRTLSTGGNAFNPMALFASRPQPILAEPPGRAEGLEERLDIYRQELKRLGRFVKRQDVPVVFMLPAGNLADFEPFGSMVRPGTDPARLEELNRMLLEALADNGPTARDRYLEILAMDDGIAEANFQLARLYLNDGHTEKAREHFQVASDRDLVLKRLPGDFHAVSRDFVARNGFRYLDEGALFESKSDTGVLGYNWLDDDVHPSREGQFELGTALARMILEQQLLPVEQYRGDVQSLPAFADYNAFTGFSDADAGMLEFLKAAHNYLAFGRFRQRLRWHPEPAQFLDPVLDLLDHANRLAPRDESRYMSAVLRIYLGRNGEAVAELAMLGCRDSADRARQVYGNIDGTTQTLLGNPGPEIRNQISAALSANGCHR